MSLKSILNKHEQEKKRQYNQRIMNIEHGTFTPLVYTTTGVMGHECDLYHKALADRISRKKGDRYDDIMQYLRTKLSFLALKGVGGGLRSKIEFFLILTCLKIWITGVQELFTEFKKLALLKFGDVAKSAHIAKCREMYRISHIIKKRPKKSF